MLLIVSVLLAVLPLHEVNMITHVAKEYNLTEHEIHLLVAIRKVENGGVGLYFGVGQDIPGHPARRYRESPVRSYLVQCKWAAGTIDKRYDGDLEAFAKRYCPRNAEVWQRNVQHWLHKLEAQTARGKNM